MPSILSINNAAPVPVNNNNNSTGVSTAGTVNTNQSVDVETLPSTSRTVKYFVEVVGATTDKIYSFEYYANKSNIQNSWIGTIFSETGDLNLNIGIAIDNASKLILTNNENENINYKIVRVTI